MILILIFFPFSIGIFCLLQSVPWVYFTIWISGPSGIIQESSVKNWSPKDKCKVAFDDLYSISNPLYESENSKI